MAESKRNTRGTQTFYALKDGLLALLEEKPSTKITVDEICQRCGVTKGAFYHHFSSREELLGQVYTAKMSGYMAHAIRRAQEDYPGEPAKQIRIWVEALMDFSIKYRGDICKHLYKGAHSSGWLHIVSDWNTLAQTQLSTWQSEGLLRNDVSADDLHAFCDSFTYGFSALFAAEYVQNPIPAVLVESFVNTLLPPSPSER